MLRYVLYKHGEESRITLPSSIQVPAPENLSLLENSHGPPFRLIGCVHEATGLDAESSSLAASRCPLDLGYVDVLASVELECRLGAVDLQVHLRVRVREAREELQRLGTSIQGDLGRIGLGDEDVVDVRLRRCQGKRGGDIAGEFLDAAERDAGRVKGQVVVGEELRRCPVDRGGIGDVEITFTRTG